MKKLALLFTCWAYFAAMGSFIQAQSPVNVNLNVGATDKIRPSKIEAHLEVEGLAEFDYMKIESGDKYAAVILGYNENSAFDYSLYLNERGLDTIHLTLKDLDGTTDWNRINLGYNRYYPAAAIVIGDYISDAEDLGDGWFRVSIPFTDLSSSVVMNQLTFPHANHVNFGIKEILLTGGGSSFQWFGDQKYDNAIKENVPGESELIFKSGGIIVEEMRLKMLDLGNELVHTSMPNKAFYPTIIQGENRLMGVVIDKQGNHYYSDTVTVFVPKGLTYEVEHVSCYGQNDGSINISIQGGNPPYTYAWSHGPDTEDVSGLAPGVYQVQVLDADNKSASATVAVKQPNELAAQLTQSNCSATEALLNITGGKAPYAVSIDEGDFVALENDPANVVWEVKTNRSVDEYDFYNYAASIGTDPLNNVYIGGRFKNELIFGGGSVGEEGKKGAYLVKLNEDGSFAWSFATKNGWLMDLAVDSDGSSVILVDVSEYTSPLEEYTSNYYPGSYIIKIDPNGEFLWVRKLWRGLRNIGIDASGNIYTIGKQPITWNQGNGRTDVMLVKYNKDGLRQWQKTLGGKETELNLDLHVTDNGDLFITGLFRGTMHFDGIKLQSSGLDDMYTARLNSDGEVMWAFSAGGGNSNDRGMSITEDRHGKVYLTAEFLTPNVEFGGTVFTNPVNILCQLDASDGAVQWTRAYTRMYSISFSASFGIAVQSQNKIYVSATISAPIVRDGDNYDPIDGEAVIMEFDSTGSIMFSKPIGYGAYDVGIVFPLAVTNDNHTIAVDYYNKFSILKLGADMQENLNFTAAGSVVVKDANNCTFIMEDISFEQEPPSPPAICYINPTSNGSGNLLFWTAEQEQDIAYFNVYRETYAVGEFEKIGTVEAGVTQFSDTTVDILERSYRYAVTAVDTCDYESEYSESHQTMHLTVNEGNKGQVNLIWDGYQGFEYKSFHIYRGSSEQDMQLLAQLPSYLFTYTDFDPSPSTLYYQIRVESDQDCIPGETATVATGRQTKESGARVVASNIAARFGQAGELSFYPNPGDDVVHAKFSPDGDEYQLRVIDASGRVVRSIDHVFDKATIERGNLPAGIYTVVVSKNTGEPLRGRIIFR